MKVEKKGNDLVITMPLSATPKASGSGKTLIVGGTGGFIKTSVEHNGQTISLSVNATIPNK